MARKSLENVSLFCIYKHKKRYASGSARSLSNRPIPGWISSEVMATVKRWITEPNATRLSNATSTHEAIANEVDVEVIRVNDKVTAVYPTNALALTQRVSEI